MSCSPPDIHILVPLIEYEPSVFKSALVLMSAREEPAWGSDKHMVPNQFPSTKFGRYFLFNSSEPHALSMLATP